MKISSYSFSGRWVKLVREKKEYEGITATTYIRKNDIVTYSNGELVKSYTEQTPPFERKHEHEGYRAIMTLRGGREFHIEFDDLGKFSEFIEDMNIGLRTVEVRWRT